MEAYEAVLQVKPEERRHVAVADEDLGGPLHQGRVQKRQELRAAVAAAHRHERRNRRIVPRVVDGRGAHGGLAGDVALSRKDALVVDRFEAKAFELDDPGVELFSFERAGRRHQRDAIARPQPARLHPAARDSSAHRKAAISAAIA